jgi:carbon starvation protein CstA
LLPLAFVGTTTLTAGWKSVTDNFIPMISKPGLEFQGYLNTILTLIMMTCAVIIILNSLWRWRKTVFPTSAAEIGLARAPEQA